MGFTPRKVDQYTNVAVSSHDHNFTPGRAGAATANANTAMVANVQIFVPVRFHERCTVREWWHSNGTLTTAYNVEYGIYDESFNRLFTTGSLTGVTTASLIVNTTGTTDFVIEPGSYYMSWLNSSTRNIICSADAAGLYQAMGCMEQTGVTLGSTPNPAVPVAYTRAFLPVFGMNLHGTAF